LGSGCCPILAAQQLRNFFVSSLPVWHGLSLFVTFWRNDMSRFAFNVEDADGFKMVFNHCKTWALEHQAEVGLAEMALGASIVALGLHSGQIHVGPDMVATDLSAGGLTGGGIGAGIAGIGATLLGSIGVAGACTFGIPAMVLAGGGMIILGAAGYGAGDITQRLLSPDVGISDLVAGGSMLVIGTALMIDGARRVVTDERILRMASKFKNSVIELVPLLTKVVAKTSGELKGLMQDFSKHGGFSTATSSVIAAAGGAAIGNAAAIGSVTVLGSHGLGSAALTMGLVSAPVWPVIACGAAGLAIGFAAWKGIRHLRN
jgi:hypothetical protein